MQSRLSMTDRKTYKYVKDIVQASVINHCPPVYMGKASIVPSIYSNTHVNKGDKHGQADDPRSLLFEEPSQLVDATVKEGIPGYGVPALGRQRLTEGQIVAGAISAAAADL